MTHTVLTSKVFEVLKNVYGEDIAREYTPKLTALVVDNPIPKRSYKLDQSDVIVIAYGDHIKRAGQAPLATLHEFSAKYLTPIANTVHILPHYPYTSDDGFAVSDYSAVNPELGTWADVKSFSNDFSLMFDAVINHVSASHEWFQKFLTGDPAYQKYFFTLEPDTDVSAVVRPRATPLLHPFKTSHGTKYLWTTFSDDQIDLNYANPQVIYDLMKILLDYVHKGADLIRLDAIGFIWRNPAESSIHHPNAHAIIKLMHEILAQAAPWVMLVTETNVPHKENVSYFGNGHDEAQMVYNFALPPLVLHTLQTGDATVLGQWAAGLEVPSDATAFFNFTASHDGIGVRGVTGILTDEEVKTMCDRAIEAGGGLGMRTLSDGSEAIYEMNTTYFNAIAGRDVDAPESIDKFICSQAIPLSLPGVPGIYLHSLLGSTNWYDGVKQTGRNRTINREKLDMDVVERELADPTTRRAKVFSRYSELLQIRKKQAAFHPNAAQRIVEYGPGIFAVERTADNGECILALHNVTAETHAVELQQPMADLLTGQGHSEQLKLLPYQVSWLKV